MKGTGIMTKKVELALIFMPIKKFIQEDGLMERNMAMGFMNIKTETSMMESG